MAERSFAGFTYSQRLTVGFYGEVYRGRSSSSSEVEVLHVDPAFTAQPGFAQALTDHATELGRLSHRNAVSTFTVGNASDGSLVVITEPTIGSPSAETLLEAASSAGMRLPQGIALAIARLAVAGLAAAHKANIVHGGIHPRSVVVGKDGGVRVTDFAVARALAVAAAASDDAELYKGFGGYLAPELALGDPPSAATDVYAMGAFIFTLLQGEPPPGDLDMTPSVEHVIKTALATDLSQRYADARELERELVTALATDGCHMSSAEEIAAHLDRARASTEQRLDAGLDDLLSSLGDDEDPTNVAPEVIAAQTEADLDDEETLVAPEVADHTEETGLTEVDPFADQVRDPVSELIELDKNDVPTGKVDLHDSGGTYDDEHTPLPLPRADAPGTLTRAELGISNPRGKPSVEERALGAIASLEQEDADDEEHHDTIRRDKPRPRPRPAVAVDEPQAQELSLKKSRSALWIGITILSLAGMFAYLWFETDLFHPERKRAREEARKRKQAEIDEAAKPPPVGIVAIDIEPPNSAVWMSLGKAPAVTPLMVPSASVWQLRFERDGYVTKDVNVVASHWSGDGKARKATVKATLKPGTAKRVKAAPAPPKPADQTGLRDGQGRIHADAEPSGAEVWLFLGVGDVQRLALEAGKAYRFKLVKDGYEPAFVTIAANDWSGRSGEQISRTVELTKRKKK